MFDVVTRGSYLAAQKSSGPSCMMRLQHKVVCTDAVCDLHKTVGALQADRQIAPDGVEHPIGPARAEVQRVIAKRCTDLDRFCCDGAVLGRARTFQYAHCDTSIDQERGFFTRSHR